MMENLYSKLEFLFNQDFFSDDFDPEGECLDEALELLRAYSWKDIYSGCYDLFTTKFTTPSKLYNALNLYYVYTFADYPIDNPYEFIGYIFYTIDVDGCSDEYGDFIESLAISILDVSLGTNHIADAYYRPWEDGKTLAVIELWRAKGCVDQCPSPKQANLSV